MMDYLQTAIRIFIFGLIIHSTATLTKDLTSHAKAIAISFKSELMWQGLFFISSIAVLGCLITKVVLIIIRNNLLISILGILLTIIALFTYYINAIKTDRGVGSFIKNKAVINTRFSICFLFLLVEFVW